MEDYTDQDLLAELLASDPAIPERHGGVIPQEFAQARGISTRYASLRLHEMWQAGKLRRELNMVDGQRMYVYYRV